MDYIPPNSNMFQSLFDQATTTDELLQLISSTFPKHEINQEDHQVPPPTPSQKGPEPTLAGRRCRSSTSSAAADENPNDKKKKKMLHRDIEKQRRQEMSNLYASLRSLIPLQYLKGKRSTSDQMQEATKYIKDLEIKIEKMSAKRDSLKKLSDPSDIIASHDQNNNFEKLESTKISLRHCGKTRSVEVLVNTAFNSGLSLERILRALAAEGFDVISCVSAKVNQRFLHTIQSQDMSEERSLDLSKLEQKLNNLIV